MWRKILFDADPYNMDAESRSQGNRMNACGADPKQSPCPSFIANSRDNTIELKDKYKNMVPMAVGDFNEFVCKAKSGEIQKVPSILSGNEIYMMGSSKFSADANTNMMVFTNASGKTATISVKHFNIFVDAAIDGRMQEM